jgi:hypothetical protein
MDREEGPLIRQALADVENALRTRDRQALDSLLHPEAAKDALTPDSLIAYIYPSSDYQFGGFTNKLVIQRNPYARVDCDILGTSEELRQVTITMKRTDDGRWLLKNIGPRLDDPLEDDSL